MIVDSSALVAILREEPRSDRFTSAIESADRSALSAATYLETSIVITEVLHPRLDELLDAMGTPVVPFDGDQAREARRAFARYGRGSGTRARLNFGDCFSYALAKVRDEPLLFKGEDFTHIDVEPAYRP